MQDSEHLEFLREQGVDAWNSWRQSNPEIVPDLRGVDLSREKLDNIDLSNADIRGTIFAYASLKGANFTNARAGVRKSKLDRNITFYTLGWVYSSSIVLGFAGYRVALFLTSADIVNQYSLIPGFSVLVLLAIIMGSIAVHGLTVKLFKVSAFAILGFIATLSGVGGTLVYLDRSIATADISAYSFGIFSLTIFAIIYSSFSRILISVFLITRDLNIYLFYYSKSIRKLRKFQEKFVCERKAPPWLETIPSSLGFLLPGVFLFPDIVLSLDLNSTNLKAFLIGLFINNVNLCLSKLIRTEVLFNTFKYKILRDIALAHVSESGTTFYKSDLSDADFTQAVLVATDFRNALVDRTCWMNAKLLDWARLDGTMLVDLDVLELLVTKEGKGRDYRIKYLRGANLIDANLENSNLTQTFLGGALLQGANLEQAKLIKTEVFGSDLSQAILTGACIEDWSVNSATNLENVACDYIYLKADEQERRPSDPKQNFGPGDFSRLFQKSIETVDLIFRDGIDWQAFSTSLQELRDEQIEFTESTKSSPAHTVETRDERSNQSFYVRTIETRDERSNQSFPIRAIETRDDGTLVVRISVPQQVDKAEIETLFKHKYERELQARDEQISIYRQHNATLEGIVNTTLEGIVAILASRPIEINNKINNNNMNRANNESQGDTFRGKFGIGKMTDGEIQEGAKVAGVLNERFPEILQLTESLRQNVQSLSDQTIRETVDEYLSDLEAEIAQPEPKKSRLTATLQVLWSIGKDITLLANGITALAERFGISLPHLPSS